MPELEMVHCERRTLRLSAQGCERAWRSANPVAPPVWEGTHKCHQCPAGAKRCGQTINPVVAARDRLAVICPRCCKVSDRIINDWLCVSCYNRHLEVVRGRNRKGGVPRLASRLGTLSCVVVQSGQPKTITWNAVTGLIEAAIASARSSVVPMMFGRRRGVPPALLALPRAPSPYVQLALPL